MFSKILIANRGEIACRVIKTARRMGIKTVAVFSDADRDAVHVEMADEAVHIGPPPAAQSYLLIDKIVAACKQTGAEAVHPGYGFLSERAAFPRALSAEGIVFIGPNPNAIDAMGDKIQSKIYAAKAGVSTVPGNLDVIATPEDAVRVSDEIGYPVMIKASAGGGGKGMRIAWNPAEAAEGFVRAKSEAAASFGDDRVFIEKFIVNPRHIEIQLLGDKHGNVIYLNERECSIQRRNQKVIEEAPSPLLDAATRKAMGEQSVALAKAVGYDSAGTVEFVAGQDRSFFFLEMNTRLQVEHPVTELITGIDLVEQMIRVAAGEKLSITQADVKIDGWAVESRVYAEDPYRNFLPSTGRLVKYRPPAEGLREDDVTVRNDTGVTEGSEISMFYDPMIAKLVTHGPTRLAAIDAQAEALDEFVIDGIQPNIPFLTALMQHPRWRSGNLSTGFIKEEYPDGFSGRPLDEEARRVLAIAALSMEMVRKERLDHHSDRLKPHSGKWRSEWVVRLGREQIAVEVPEGYASVPLEIDVLLDGHRSTVSSDWRPGEPLWHARIGDDEVAVQVRPAAAGMQLSWRGVVTYARAMLPPTAKLDALMPEKTPPDMSKYLLCPMPGLVVSIAVTAGQDVKAGETLAVVEAMKMENVLRAERDGVVKVVNAKPGDSLAVDAVILEFA
ncbi:acetyl-CoA carboxylase biotin carboxylase subunit [Oharaeibacter diazotrophicus]|uniref:propionyl-CoA carboxylase n=1 Tax=Oharaeibacter diazotrophicus TaxID=1920512 RepID=A0A4V3CWH4_9HYPH|nr:acetyl/propionyl/methylcrotonyl-CoA carboxylase subunit alpha [Oharaeibacter diazotrophicus]TDP86398.1 biotin carboxyl carrier protein /biotin carboxylase [Oharaeibacter diazotrophicus]BBE71659.1 acetyl-CoA carboxylase [Pleomorphomonas sp. SM30]GLS78424.1 acetyl/propionyl-CoA carboxylase subunit alpha [Oharaeibacter diazotrophicus]